MFAHSLRLTAVLLLLGHDFRHQRRLANDFFQTPALQLRERPRLFQPDYIADMGLILLVMGVKLLRFGDHPRIQRVRPPADHLHHDGLVHSIGNHMPNQFFSSSGSLSFRHHFFSPAAARSCTMVFTRAISLRNPRNFFRLSVCPMLSWNFSL